MRIDGSGQQVFALDDQPMDPAAGNSPNPPNPPIAAALTGAPQGAAGQTNPAAPQPSTLSRVIRAPDTPQDMAELTREATTVPYHGMEIRLRPSVAADASPASRVHARTPDTLHRPSSASNGVTSAFLNQNSRISDPEVLQMAGGRPVPSGCLGCTLTVMHTAATKTSQGNLFEAAGTVQRTFERGGDFRESLLNRIDQLQSRGEWSGASRELPGYVRHPGTTGLGSGRALVADLERHFAHPYNPAGDRMGYPETFALVGLSLGNAPAGSFASTNTPAHTLAVQRSHAQGDYRADSYTVYDPSYGAFRYDNFAQTAYALENYYHAAYPGAGGYTSANTSYYAMQNVQQAPLGRQRLGDVGNSYGIPALPAPLASDFFDAADPAPPLAMPPLTPPRAHLPPPPNFDRPGPSGHPPAHTDLRRDVSATADNQPFATFRPSVVAPGTLRAQGGFSAAETPLQQINLDMHDFDASANPATLDSAGYLGTFRQQDGAEHFPALGAAKTGFVYWVAPTPNMVDVAGSLGANARQPQRGEVAALGRIDYAQIRGWQEMTNGKAGTFVANPDYRWDIYDQTRSSGAQPQLARFAEGSDAWLGAAHRPFVDLRQDGERTAPAVREDPNRSVAGLYNHAARKIEMLDEQRRAGEDYRGPVQLISHDGAFGRLQANVHAPAGRLFSIGPDDTDVTVAKTAADSGGFNLFKAGDDGRLHTSVFGEDAVLRIKADGYLYLGSPPADPANLNGVFRYQDGRLIHQEDGKAVTYSSAGYAYVSDHDYDSSYSMWKFTDETNRRYTPPRSVATYPSNGAGSARTLYAFERDPDSALPPGTTRFVTQPPPGQSAFDSANAFERGTPAAQRQATAAWLRDGNRALLLKDGYYVTPNTDGDLQIRNLEGTPLRTLTVAGAPAGANELAPSGYVIPARTWERLTDDQKRRDAFESWAAALT